MTNHSLVLSAVEKEKINLESSKAFCFSKISKCIILLIAKNTFAFLLRHNPEHVLSLTTVIELNQYFIFDPSTFFHKHLNWSTEHEYFCHLCPAAPTSTERTTPGEGK